MNKKLKIGTIIQNRQTGVYYTVSGSAYVCGSEKEAFVVLKPLFVASTDLCYEEALVFPYKIIKEVVDLK